MLPLPMAPIEQAFHLYAAQCAAQDAAIDSYCRAGRVPPPALLDRRRALEVERQRLILNS